jgi:hypothetical protein
MLPRRVLDEKLKVSSEVACRFNVTAHSGRAVARHRKLDAATRGESKVSQALVVAVSLRVGLEEL